MADASKPDIDNYTPPRSADIFLEWFCHIKYVEEIRGDLFELFNSKTNSRIILHFLYWLEVIKYFRPFFWKNNLFNLYGSSDMFLSFFKISLRNLRKQGFYSALNILGLAIGLASAIFIILYIHDELSYDKFNEDYKNIYRLTVDAKFDTKYEKSALSSFVHGTVIKENFPEVKSFTRITAYESFIITYGEKSLKEKKIITADPNIFNLFKIDLLEGNKKNALSTSSKAIISESIANKFFFNESPIGKVIKLDNLTDVIITGVFKNFPITSHFKPNIIMGLADISGNDWTNLQNYTYLKLKKNANIKVFENKINRYGEKILRVECAKTGVDYDKIFNNSYYNLILQPLDEIHLHSNFEHEFEKNGDITDIYIFGTIAFLIILLASVNFINLSTAKVSLRAKEIGIKKIVGSGKKLLIFQFLAESLLITFISFFISLIFVIILKKFIALEIGVIVTSGLFDNFYILPSIILLVILTGLIAGIFPALIFSSTNPLSIIKGSFNGRINKNSFRNVLVIFQFSISLVMICLTFIIYNQLSYINEKKIGYDKEQTIVVNDSYLLGNYSKIKTFTNTISNIPSIKSLTISGFLPITSTRSSRGVMPDGLANQNKMSVVQTWRIDENYLKTLGIDIREGRNFSENFNSDSNSVIINETYAKILNFSNPLAHSIAYLSNNQLKTFRIIGVTKDFHYESLKYPIQPLIFFNGKSSGAIAIKVNGNIPKTIELIKEKWKNFSHSAPFNYSFLDKEFENMYNDEVRTGRMFTIFTFISIFICCLGLVGLSTFVAERRIKEIGIRKTLGASIYNLLFLLIKDFLGLIFISFFISIPLSYFLMKEYLANFAYKTDISIVIFFFAGLVTLIISLVSVSYQSIKASLINPSKTLKCD